MHDTALEIGKRAIEIYGGKAPRILEVGAMDVNGSLRQFAPEGSEYLGVDLEAGKGVDMVVEAGKPLPFKKGSFDLVLASSVFEHDPAFWSTFLDLARVLRNGGHLYMNAPSNGMVHRYPEDHWRFYPDSGLALERWANSQGLPVRLIESFTAPRKGDHWNDFVAVFRRGRKTGDLSGRLLHSACNGKNVWTIGASQPLKPSDATEDMQLLKAEQGRARALEAQLAERDAAKEAALSELQTLQSTLRQREEEIHQTRREKEELATASDARIAELTAQLAKLEADIAAHQKQLADAERDRDTAAGQVEEAQTELDRRVSDLKKLRKRNKRSKQTIATLEARLLTLGRELQATTENAEEHSAAAQRTQEALSQTRAALSQAELSVRQRFDELAALTRFLREAECERQEATEHREWLTQVHQVVAQTPWWWALLPPSMRAEREHRRLKQAGLFDAKAYLDLYPDVAAERMDPLRHYILHGMDEGRRLTR